VYNNYAGQCYIKLMGFSGIRQLCGSVVYISYAVHLYSADMGVSGIQRYVGQLYK
jgi:hypothetical protein